MGSAVVSADFIRGSARDHFVELPIGGRRGAGGGLGLRRGVGRSRKGAIHGHHQASRGDHLVGPGDGNAEDEIAVGIGGRAEAEPGKVGRRQDPGAAAGIGPRRQSGADGHAADDDGNVFGGLFVLEAGVDFEPNDRGLDAGFRGRGRRHFGARRHDGDSESRGGGGRGIAGFRQGADDQVDFAGPSRRRRDGQALQVGHGQGPGSVAVVGTGGKHGPRGHVAQSDGQHFRAGPAGQRFLDVQRQGAIWGCRIIGHPSRPSKMPTFLIIASWFALSCHFAVFFI